MHEREVRQERVVHVLEEEGGPVEDVEGYPVGPTGGASGNVNQLAVAAGSGRGGGEVEAHSFTRSSCSFFGTTSSIMGARSGYISVTFARIARCAEDLTLVLAEGDILRGGAQC